jgi:NAD(P)-dependent dehydrogenase (short-subunit alcohol dehydrogenase family)
MAGQVAWVTGGGSGIGLAGATELAKAGCKVIISGRDAAKLEAAAKLAGAHGEVSAMPLDVGDRDAVKAAAETILARHGTVDVLVNSAGVNFPKRFWKETDAETFDKVFAINLNGAMYTSLAVLHAMRAKGSGTVINIASFAGWYPSYLTGPAYIASKAALMALTHSFNIEECVAGLRATVICRAKWPRRSWKSARCRLRRPSARECCRRRTWGAASALSPRCRRAPASTNW